MDILSSDKALTVFAPGEWKGISGFEPLEFNFRSDMPTEHKAPYRPINPRIFQDTKKEFNRMCQYMYIDSDSPVASPLVVAPKATSSVVTMSGLINLF